VDTEKKFSFVYFLELV